MGRIFLGYVFGRRNIKGYIEGATSDPAAQRPEPAVVTNTPVIMAPIRRTVYCLHNFVILYIIIKHHP